MSFSKYAAITLATSLLLASAMPATNQRRRVAAVSLALRENATPQRFGTLSAGITSPSASSHTRATGSPRRTPPRETKPTSMRRMALSDERPLYYSPQTALVRSILDEVATEFHRRQCAGEDFMLDDAMNLAQFLGRSRGVDLATWIKANSEAFSDLREEMNEKIFAS